MQLWLRCLCVCWFGFAVVVLGNRAVLYVSGRCLWLCSVVVVCSCLSCFVVCVCFVLFVCRGLLLCAVGLLVMCGVLVCALIG